ncbi:MAG: 23S rRNA methyltransferase [Gammaproteobacteria bacterium]|nr:23S rRNA methyltransferase [Gammaproteobacteria bacterium]
MSKSSRRWVQEHERDPYVRQARQSQYRSRAVYKLMEIDRQDHLFRRGQTVIDLGAAPGSWSQFASERVGAQGKVIAVDILTMEPVPDVLFIMGDFTEQQTVDDCLRCLSGSRVDLVISDMAPNISGIRHTDQARSMYLAELVFEFSTAVLKPGGNLLVKVFQGADVEPYRRRLVDVFQRVKHRKPKASRDSSREFYMLAQGYNV